MKKAKHYLIALLSGVLVATTVLSGCGQSEKAVSENDDHLTVYLWENRLMKNIVPYIYEQFPDQDIEFITGNNDTDLYSYFEEHGELPDIITVRRFSGTDAQNLEPYLMDFASYDVVSRYYSYALQYYKNSKDEIQWLPICGMPQTIIANKTLFEQFGIKIPENYKEYAQACQQFYDYGIKPYSLDLAEDWSAHEVIQTGAIGEFMSLDGIKWRSSAESSSGDIAFDDALWKRIFSETNTFLKDSHFTSDDISVDINTAAQMFLEGKAAMFHGYPALMQEYQEQMDAELTRIPFFSQISDEAFINMTPSLNIAFNKDLEKDQEKLDLAFDVLDRMISKEGQTLIAEGKGVISLNVDVPNMMEDVPGLEDEINNNSVYIRYSAQKSFDASLKAVHGLLSGEMDETQAYDAFRSTMNSKDSKEETTVNFENEYAISLNDKNGRDRSVSSTVQEEKNEQNDNIFQGMRFLCAEDNELNAEILTELLKIEGAECTICENGEEILKTFEKSAPGDYDMILMDVQMPVMNGYEATKAIRRSSHELAKKIPIIAMTANAFSEDIQHSLAAGMNAHVSKPVEMRVLEKTIRSIKTGGGAKLKALINNH